MKRGGRLKRTAGPKRRNKFGAKSCVGPDGFRYHSRMEADYAARLELLKKAADPAERVASFKRQVNIPLRGLNGGKVCVWIADFEVTFADERVEIHEVKGFETPEWRIKEKLFLDNFPDRPMKVIR